MKKSFVKKLATAVAVLAIATPTLANTTVHTFTYDGGKKAEIYTSSYGVFVKTPVNNWDTKFEKGSSGDCEFKKYGSCYSKSQMIAEVESKTRSGEYWR